MNVFRPVIAAFNKNKPIASSGLAMCHRSAQRGQAAVMIVLALSIFLVGAVGLAIDGSHMFAQRQLAQAAADAAAQAAIMSIFDGTNGSGGTHDFSTAGAFTCASVNPTPCYYAQQLNGFKTGADTVTVDFPTAADAGVDPSKLSSDPVNLVRVTVQRSVNTTLIRLVGPLTSTVRASAVAAIVEMDSPVPIIVLHPTIANSFDKSGTNDIVICGGPSRSIQVNSRNATALNSGGTSGHVDLSHAGPADTLGDCTLGTGTDFSSSGGQTSFPGTLLLGSKGRYVQPSSPLKDPLAGVPAPSIPTTTRTDPTPVKNTTGVVTDWGCPVNAFCQRYLPGTYNAGITVSNNAMALFEPGIYYITGGGFNITNTNTAAAMVPSTCGSCAAPPSEFSTKGGMLVYNSGSNKDDIINFGAGAGKYSPSGTELGINLVGADDTSIYKGILFFQDHAGAKHYPAPGGWKPHSIQGGSNLSVKGTIYLTNLTNMTATNYQAISLQGSSGSSTKISGQIITDALALGGSSTITMNLNSSVLYKVRQVALVK